MKKRAFITVIIIMIFSIETVACASWAERRGYATLGTKQGEQIESSFKKRAKEDFDVKDEANSFAQKTIEKPQTSKRQVVKKSKLQRKLNYFVKRKFVRFFRFFGLLRTIKKAKKTNPKLLKVLFWGFVAIFVIGEKPLWVPPVIKGMTAKVKEARDRKRDSAATVNIVEYNPGEISRVSEQMANNLIFPQASDQQGWLQPGKGGIYPPVYSESVLPNAENAFFSAA
jgi:hypothetical protein